MCTWFGLFAVSAYLDFCRTLVTSSNDYDSALAFRRARVAYGLLTGAYSNDAITPLPTATGAQALATANALGPGTLHTGVFRRRPHLQFELYSNASFLRYSMVCALVVRART